MDNQRHNQRAREATGVGDGVGKSDGVGVGDGLGETVSKASARNTHSLEPHIDVKLQNVDL